MSVRCMPTSCSGSQFDKVPRTSWGSVFALARVCTAPMQPHYFTHYYSRMFVRTSSLTLDAMCVCVRARVCQGSTRSRRPLGGRFSPLHASPARRCTRVRSPTDYYACPCAHVQRHSMQYVCACVQMAYMVLCAHGKSCRCCTTCTTGVGFRPSARPQRASAAARLHPPIIANFHARKLNATRCNVCVRASTSTSGVYTLSRTSSGSVFASIHVCYR